MRKHYIDNLRWITILLLIPYHAAMAWNIWNEPNYIFFEGNKIISSIIIFLNPYFMPMLFMLSGISTRLSLLKRTPKQYISERVKKLLIPLIFGTLCIMPIMTYIADKFNYGFKGNLFSHYIIFFTKYTDLTGSDGGFSIGQFWFILYLLIISLITLLPITMYKKKTKNSKEIPLWFIVILGFPLPLLSEILSIAGKSFAEYTYLFLMGYFVFSDDLIINKIQKHKWLFLFIGLTATIINVYMFIWSDIKHPFINNAAKFISEWFMLIALIGSGKKYLNYNGKISNYISKKSFNFYIFHFIWIIIFQYLLYDIFNDNTVALYILPVCLSYISTLLCCETVSRISITLSLTQINSNNN